MSDPSEANALKTVRVEYQMPASIERVWSYLVDSDKRGTWLAAGAMEPRLGGRVELNFLHSTLSRETAYPERYKKMEGGHRMIGRVTRWEPPHALAYTWGGMGDHESEVTFELSARGEKKTLLVITHRRLRGRGEMISVASGWDTHVGILIDTLNGDEPRGFWSTHEKRAAEYEKQTPADA